MRNHLSITRGFLLSGAILGLGALPALADGTLDQDWSDTCPDCGQTITVPRGSPDSAIDEAIARHRSSCPGRRSSSGDSATSVADDGEADRQAAQAAAAARAEQERQLQAAREQAEREQARRDEAERQRRAKLLADAEQATQVWAAEDAASLETAKKPAGLPPLLRKMQKPVYDDANVVDLRDTSVRAPRIPGDVAGAESAGGAPLAKPLGASVPRIAPPVTLLPPEQVLPRDWRRHLPELPPEYVEFIKEKTKDLKSTYLSVAIQQVFPRAGAIYDMLHNDQEFSDQLVEKTSQHLDRLWDLVGRANNPDANLGALGEEAFRSCRGFGEEVDKLANASARSAITRTETDEVAKSAVDANEVTVAYWRRSREQ
jgi:hypothetical protein